MKREAIVIHTPFIRLDALLKFAGIAGTGGHAKELIAQGTVFVDGQVCLERGRKIYPGALVATELRELEVVGGEG